MTRGTETVIGDGGSGCIEPVFGGITRGVDWGIISNGDGGTTI